MAEMTVDLKYCDFNKVSGALMLASERFAGGFPSQVSIRSEHTGNIVRFVPDDAAALAAEFWDGEMREYIPIDPVNNCKKLVVYHAF